jgi:hypothetical protein
MTYRGRIAAASSGLRISRIGLATDDDTIRTARAAQLQSPLSHEAAMTLTWYNLKEKNRADTRKDCG